MNKISLKNNKRWINQLLKQKILYNQKKLMIKIQIIKLKNVQEIMYHK